MNHPNIASIFDFDSCDGVDFIVMELLSGVRLSDRMAEGPLPESEASNLGQQILSALREAHNHGIVHQDLRAYPLPRLSSRHPTENSAVDLVPCGCSREALRPQNGHGFRSGAPALEFRRSSRFIVAGYFTALAV